MVSGSVVVVTLVGSSVVVDETVIGWVSVFVVSNFVVVDGAEVVGCVFVRIAADGAGVVDFATFSLTSLCSF